MLISEKLRQEDFPSSQQAVVDFILADPMAIKTMTIRELAKKTYTSNATMVRIAQKLGYTGWEEFRDALIREQEYLALSFSNVNPNIPFTAADTLASIAAKTAELKMEAIQDTLNLVDEESVMLAANIIKNSAMVNILASNNTAFLAQLFALKLGRLHILALAPENARGECRYNGTLQRSDACTVIISYSGETPVLIEACRLVKAAGRPLIVLTSIGDNTISRMADVVLRFCTREKMSSKINWYTTESGIEYLLDLLYSTLFWMDYETNIERRMGTARKIERNRISTDSIIAESESEEVLPQT